VASKLDQLRAMTTVVADTGDIEAVRRFRPTDCTTNPTLVLKAAQSPAGIDLIKEACLWGRSHHGMTSRVADRLTVSFGAELSRIVPGRVSTEVDADLSFDMTATVAKARAFVADYQSRGIGRDRILIKIAATWEGIEAARVLQREGIDCNLTLVFSLAQAAACAEAGVFLISPFVGRIYDWHVKAENRDFTAENDPGVRSVRQIYDYFKAYDISTVVMGASFRTLGEIEALAGCDRLTIAPQWLEQLGAAEGTLVRALDPAKPSTRVPARMTLDEKSFRFLMNDDAMATEKLAEGIRLFAKDLRALRELVSRRLEGFVDPLAAPFSQE
jgi:transaldolase